jgi:RNA polymerase sigma factor (sigma-70 family)
LWKELDRGSEILNVRAWLYRVAGNMTINHLKAQSRARSHQPEVNETVRRWHSSPGDIERATVRRQLVGRVLKQLPEPMRQCLLLYHEGLTGREIAEVLGIKPSYVGTLVLRAHERFRRECDSVGGGYDLLG